MKSFRSFLPLALLGALAVLPSTSVSAISQIHVNGNQLIDSATNLRFFAKGMGYDYSLDDTTMSNWKAAVDEIVLSAPHVNVLRTYITDITLQYDEFMAYTASKGIYVIISLSAGDGCGNLPRGGTPALDANTCYPSCLLSFGEAVIAQFSQYDNTLAFVVANEVMNDGPTWAAAPCVKAYARDLKAYMSSCGLRQIPLMYTAADNPIPSYTPEATDRLKADYLSCGDASQGIDIFGLNMFRWCGDTCSYASCGYQQVHDALVGAAVPVLLTEYGCGAFVYGNGVFGMRSWKDTGVLYTTMADVFSGGAAYSYGVRGGLEFSFFNGGSQDPMGATGTNKTCGYTINGNACDVDLYEDQLAGAVKLMSTSVSTTSPARPSCPAKVNGFDMTLPVTRQGAPGFYFVQCPASTGKKIANTAGSPSPPNSWYGFGTSTTVDPKHPTASSSSIFLGGTDGATPVSIPTSTSTQPTTTTTTPTTTTTTTPTTTPTTTTTTTPDASSTSSGSSAPTPATDPIGAFGGSSDSKNGAISAVPMIGMVLGLAFAAVLGM